MRVSFNGNFLIKFPSPKARDASELHIRCMDNEDFLCEKVDKDKLHIMTGKEAKDWEDMTEICHKCNYTRFPSGMHDVVNDYFIKTAVPLDFSKVKQQDDFLNGCLKQLVKEKPDYTWLSGEAEKIIKQ